jgi:hypothetical protein
MSSENISFACGIHRRPDSFLFISFAGPASLYCEAHTHTHTHTHIYIWHTHIYMYIYIHIYMYMYVCMYIYIYIHIWLRRDRMWITVATKEHCKWSIFTQIGSGAKCWLDIYHWGAGLAVIGRIRNIGQIDSESSFQTESSNSPSYFYIFSLTASAEGVFIINII